MVECFDRIHLKVAELILRPLKELAEQPALATATVRPPGREPRVEVTIDKIWPEEPKGPPAFTWTATEVAPTRDAAGVRTWRGEASHDSPESAYWAALDVIAASRRTRSFVPSPQRHPATGTAGR